MQHRWHLVVAGAIVEAVGGLAIVHPEWRWLGYVMVVVGIAPIAIAVLGPVIRGLFVGPRRRADWITLSEVVEYVADASVWVRGRSPDASWVSELRRDLLDALGNAEIASRGRRPMIATKASRYGLEPIPASFWPKAYLVVSASWAKHSDDKNKVWGVEQGEQKLSYEDVVLRWSDVRKSWKPLAPWERCKLTPFKFSVAVDEHTRKPVQVGHP